MKFDGTIKQFFFAILTAFGLSLFITQIVAAGSLPLPPVGGYGGMVQNPGPVSNLDLGVASLIVGIVLNIRYLLTAVSVVVLVYSGFRLVTSQGNEEMWKSAKSAMVFGIVGLALVGLSGELVRIFAVGKCAELGMLPGNNNLSCVEGGFLSSPNAILQRTTLFNNTIQYVITFIKYFIGALAVVMLLRNAIRMVTNSAGDELAKDKKNIMASAIGLILIIVADPIINNVLFKLDKTKYSAVNGTQPGIDYVQGVKEIVGFTNFIVSVLTPIAVLVIIVGGVMYMTSAGNPESQEKAKRMITLALAGLLVIYGAFAIVSTFLVGQFNGNAASNPAAQTQSTDAVKSP